MRSARAGSSGPGSYAPNVRSTSSRVANHPSWIAARSSASFTAQSATSPPAPASRTVQRRPVASSARRNRRAARLPDASASGHNTTGPHPLARPPSVIDNTHYASHHPARPGRARPPPRPGGAAGRRHADHAPARRRLSQPQHPTGLRRRAAALGRLARGRPG